MSLPKRASSKEPPVLRSVVFLPGDHRALFDESYYSYSDQLYGLIQLLDFANGYVLSDTLAVYGVTSRIYHVDPNDHLARFLQGVAHKDGSIETIGRGAGYDLDLTPFESAVGIPEVEARLKALAGDPSASDRERFDLGETGRVLQAQSQILLSDAYAADYIPERRYGHEALATYGHVLRNSRHSVLQRIGGKLQAELSSIRAHSEDLHVSVPCFLVEALRHTKDKAGIIPALRQIRNSKAARAYRELARLATHPGHPVKERLAAARELERRADAVFTADGLGTRIPRAIKMLIGLSAAAISLLFPPAALAPVAVELAEEADRWLQRRANIFELYSRSLDFDFYAEVRRHFPHVRFSPQQLTGFLQSHNFGWPASQMPLLLPGPDRPAE